MLGVTSRSVVRCPARALRISTRNLAAKSISSQSTLTQDSNKLKPKPTESIPLSCCPENTVLTGLNYLKDQPAVLALKDEEYPPWLWNLLKPKVYPDDGPGGKGEKMRLRAANRQRIKEQNFLKTQ